jgi:outer membrane protein assembly factor BamB
VRWADDTGPWEADGTPVVYDGRVAISTENGLFAFREGDGAPLWGRPDLKGLSTPSVWNGALVVGGWDGRLHQLDAATGEEAWNVSLADTATTKVTSSPTVFQGVAYVGTFDEGGGGGALFAIDLFSRSMLWRLNTSSIHYSSPAIAADLVVAGVTGLYNQSVDRWDPPHGLLAVHRNGDLAWFFPTDGPVASSPAVDGGRIFFATRGTRLYAVDASGEEAWNRTIGYSTSSPAVADGRVYVGSGPLGPDGRVHAFTVEGDPLWNTPVNGGVQSAVVLADGFVHVSTNTRNGSVYALDAVNGAVLWTWTASPEQYLLGSPTVADGRIFVALDSGILYALEDRGPPIPVNPAIWVVAAVIIVLVAVGVFWVRRKVKS